MMIQSGIARYCQVDIYLNQTAQFFHHEDKTHANSSYYHDCGFHYATRTYVGYRFMETWLDHVFVDDTRHGVQSGRHCAKEQIYYVNRKNEDVQSIGESKSIKSV